MVHPTMTQHASSTLPHSPDELIVVDMHNSSGKHAAHDLVQANRHVMKNVVFHPGHEHLHQQIMLAMIIIIIGSQIALWYWKKQHERSFKRVTLIGVWLLPLCMSVYFGFWRFILLWSAFSGYAYQLFRKASERPLARDAPRKVYRFFLKVYQLSSGLAAIGYVLLVIEFIGIPMVLPIMHVVTYYGILFIFYGLYFGVLDRDIAEVCAERMASTMGVTSSKKDGLPSIRVDKHTCAICLLPLRPPMRTQDGGALNDEEGEKIWTSPCEHGFHESCIRGWTIVGKKDTCSACNEKVRLEDVFAHSHPWLKGPVIWAQCLDALRYLLVWNPILLAVIQLFVYFTDR